MHNKFAVIGVGRFGGSIARVLSEKGADVLCVDTNEKNIERIKDDVSLAVSMDATDKKNLIAHKIHEMQGVVVTIGNNFEALLLCVVYLIELKTQRIIARANDHQQYRILEKLGIKEILSPEDEVGKIVAERLIHPNILSVLQLPDDYEIVELSAPKGTVNKTIEQIGLRNKYKLNLVTIKREYEEKVDGQLTMKQHILGVPSSNTVVYKTDTIVVFGHVKDVEKFLELNH